MKKINGFSIINSKHRIKPNGESELTILGVRVNNHRSDDYEYVVAQPESVDATEWPSGQYFRTLDLALQIFNQKAGIEPKAPRLSDRWSDVPDVKSIR